MEYGCIGTDKNTENILIRRILDGILETVYFIGWKKWVLVIVTQLFSQHICNDDRHIKPRINLFEIKANKTDDRSFKGVRIATMHRVKGLEFDHVFAVAVNKKILLFGSKAVFEGDIIFGRV